MTLRFDDLTPIEEEVSIGGVNYLLKELDGESSVKYDNARTDCYEYNEGKLVRVNGLAALEPLLVSLSLFKAEDQTRVPEEIIRSWPARVQKALYERVEEINQMHETVESLENQIEVLSRRLERVRKNEGTPKNSP